MRKLEDGTVRYDSDGTRTHVFAVWTFRAIVVLTVVALAVFTARQVL